MTAELSILQAEANALHMTITDAVRGLIERHPDLIVHIDGNAHTELGSPEARDSAYLEIGSTAQGLIIMRLNVDVGVTGR